MAKREVRTGLRQTWGGILLAAGIALILCLFTYRWTDIGRLSIPPETVTHNCFGPVGAWASFLLFQIFGLAAYMVPFIFAVYGVLLILKPAERYVGHVIWTVVFMVSLVILLDLQGAFWDRIVGRLDLNMKSVTGGVLSKLVNDSLLVPFLQVTGASIIAWVVLVVAVVRLLGAATLVAVFTLASQWLRDMSDRVRESRRGRTDRREEIDIEARRIEKQRTKLEEMVDKDLSDKRKPVEGPSRPGETPRKTEEAQRKAEEAQRKAEDARTRLEQQLKDKEKEKERQRAEAERARAEQAEQRRAALAAAAEDAAKKKKKEALQAAQAPEGGGPAPSAPQPPAVYELPPISLLDELPPAADRAIKGDIVTTGRILTETLLEFGIETEVANVEQGPVVTRYELKPAPGVRVEKIASLSNNLSLALKSASVMVQAPIPGKGVVGVEVPNTTSSIVYLREIFEGPKWASAKGIPLAIGKDVAGEDVVADLAVMPHLLIAGATGSGKTVCMNSILNGLLMRFSPAELRLLLVDPKIVEFAPYDGLPHLIVPVINDPHKVALGLRWAIHEMEKRYKLFARAGVRNIDSYNNRMKLKQQVLPLSEQAGEEDLSNPDDPEKLPYIIIVVDELADLMLVAQADIENCIARLAQLSRAVGIHMILATQRPSVNVITGTIKANFPARIAFQVAQKVDSRTILDANGADKLLGRGDMLFLPAGSNKLVRAQGAMVKDQELQRVIEFIRKNHPPQYEEAMREKIAGASSSGGGGGNGDGEDDELFEQAVQVIRETHRASTSSLQRRLRIGYTRAARLMDIMEERGIVGPPRGSDPREILIDLDVNMPDSDGVQAMEPGAGIDGVDGGEGDEGGLKE